MVLRLSRKIFGLAPKVPWSIYFGDLRLFSERPTAREALLERSETCDCYLKKLSKQLGMRPKKEDENLHVDPCKGGSDRILIGA